MLTDIQAAIRQILPKGKVVIGYPAKDLRAPFAVIRPSTTVPNEVAIDGEAVAWSDSYSVYCCASSVAASHKLSRDVVGLLHGYYSNGIVYQAESYSGTNIVEGLYETVVTVSAELPTL